MSYKFKPLFVAVIAAGLSMPALADDAALLRQMQEQMQQMQAQIEAMSQKLAAQGEKQEKVTAQVAKSEAQIQERQKAVQLYGQLRLSADSYSDDFGAGTAGAGGRGTTVKSNASRFGIKGEIATSLADTSMIYQAEVLYGAADNTTSEIEWREAFAGLKGDWGQTRLGRFDVPYKTTLTAIDPWNDNAPQSRGFGGRQGSSSLHSSYFTNSVEYISPSLNGFKVGAWVSKQLDDETSSIHNASPVSTYKGGDASGLGVKFNQGPWYVGADWIDIDADSITAGTPASTTLTNGNGWQIAGGYKSGAWSVGALFEDVKDLGMGKNIYLNGTYKLGKTTLIATYGQNRDAVVYTNRDIDTWSLGAKYALTKDSELFAAWVNRSEDAYLAPAATSAKDYQILTVGINAKFGY